MIMNKSLEGKVALLTGAVRRSGRDTAIKLAADGAKIVLNCKNSKDLADGVAAEINEKGGTAMVHLADITDEVQVDRMFAAIVNAYGGLDILVNNAANRGHNKIVDMPFAEWKEITSIILDGGFLCTRAAVKLMTPKKWGRVIFLGGIGPHLGYKERCHVSAGKMGSVGMMHCLATELAADGITVNVVAPGRIGGKRAPSAGEPTGIVPPVGFVGEPKDVGRTIQFLCQPEAEFITGQTIHINGGGFLT
ncbi:MAG: short-chain dehydrogenase [Rhodospirillaceae bacterium]|nr:short-chain dehydrogenase [Rhodospirillaceae bacterium]|tara:strand:+ start:268 stop:1014 length:747 start_codon:yes stop_codon:yes gene_type:complete